LGDFFLRLWVDLLHFQPYAILTTVAGGALSALGAVTFVHVVLPVGKRALRAFRRSRRRVHERLLGDPIDGEVWLYDKRTQIVAIDGAGQYPYRRDGIQIKIIDRPSFPQDIQSVWNEFGRKMEVQNATQTDTAIYNGPLLNIQSILVTRDPEERYLHATLTCFSTDYWLFKAVQTGLRENSIDSKILYDLESRDAQNPNPYLAVGVGLVLTIITNDDAIVAGRRASKVATKPGEFAIALAEGLDPNKDGSRGRVDLWEVAKRLVEEELSPEIKLKDENIQILGFGLNRKEYLYNFVGCVMLPCSFSELLRFRSRGSQGKWKTASITRVEMDGNSVREAVNRSARLGFSVWSLYLTMASMDKKVIANSMRGKNK